jgi:hypothetical protein
MFRKKSVVFRIALGLTVALTATISFSSQPAQAPYNGAWIPIGPQPTIPAGDPAGTSGATSGRVTAIAIDPTDASGNTVFIGSADGGVWKTTTGGLSVNGAPAWTPLTDNQPSLAIGALAIAIDPSNAQDANHRVIYAATGEQAGNGSDAYYGAGVLKSLDDGKTWARTCEGTAFTNPSCPFVGPFSNSFIPGGGARIGSLTVNPANPHLLLAGVQIFSSSALTGAAGQPGVYCSSDAGATWSRILPTGLSSTAVATSLVYASSTTAFMAIGRTSGDVTNGVYVSHNADQVCSAQTWTRVTALDAVETKSNMGRIELTLAPGNSSVIYAGIADATTASNSLLPGGGVFRSTDGGNSWMKTNAPDFCHSQCWNDLVLRVDPADATGNTIFAGGSDAVDSQGNLLTLIRSTDGGANWSTFAITNDQGTVLHPGHHAIAFTANGSKMYVGNDGGVWGSANAANPSTASGSQNWTNLNSGLAITQFNPGFSIHPSTPAEGFGGTRGNSAQVYSGDGLAGAPWQNTLSCGDGGFTIIDPFLPTTFLVACGDSLGATILRSDSSGARGSFFAASSGISATDPIYVTPPLVADPSTSGRYYFGTNELFQTSDRGSTWSMISCHVTNCSQSASGDLTSGNGNSLTVIVVSPSNPAVIYIGATDATVQIAKNAGQGTTATFANITAGLPPRMVTKIIVDSADISGNTAYVAFSGFAVDQSLNGGTTDLKGHIFKTVNGGASWTDISCHANDCATPLSSDLPNTSVNDLVLDPDDSSRKTLFAATDTGVFVTTNGGTSWSTLGTGLPNVAVFSLVLHEPSRTLRAATHGRSAWDYALPGSGLPSNFDLSALSPTSTSAGRTTPLQLTLTGSGFTSNSNVLWNGVSAGLSIVGTPTATSIVVNVPASFFAQSGSASVQVTDTSHSPNTTNALTFSIPGAIPVLTGIQPPSISAGAGDTQGTLMGSNFAQAAQVTFNGTANGVTINSVNADGTQINVTISHTLLLYGAEFMVGVTNPPPGGGPASPGRIFIVNSTGPPQNDNFANATVIATATLASTIDNFAATSETTDPTPSCVASASHSPAGKSVWWKFTAGSASTITAATTGSAYDAVIDVFTGAPGSFAEIACNHDAIAAGASHVQFNAVAATTYYFMVTAFDASLCSGATPNVNECGGKTVFTFSGPAPAGVAASPGANTINAGSSASFAVATFSPPLSGNVTFTLAGCPPVSTCGFNPAGVPAGSFTTLMVTTTARNSSSLPQRLVPPILRMSALREIEILAVLALLLICFGYWTRASGRRISSGIAMAGFLIFAGIIITGCGGLAGSAGPPPPPPGTPAGVYPLVVTATGNGNTTATTSITLTVN